MPIDIKIRPTKTSESTVVSVWRPITQRSHAVVKNIGKAKNCLNCSIHKPGLGRRLLVFGIKIKTTNGKAIPKPNIAKTASAIPVG